MAYCRFGEYASDVYVFGCGQGLECLSANWAEIRGIDALHEDIEVPGYQMRVGFVTQSRAVMIDHLKLHQKIGHVVPDYAIKRLEVEITELGDEY